MCEEFRPGMSAPLDEYGYNVIGGRQLEEFGWLIHVLRGAVLGYPEEWEVEGEGTARRAEILQQLEVLADVLARGQAAETPVECWGE
jgi:hypothetical protein